MRRLLLAVVIGMMIFPGCDKFGGVKSKYKSVADDMEELVVDLQEHEGTMDAYLIKGKRPESTCEAGVELASLKERAKKIRAELDAIMPEDMPFSKITEQKIIDPNTGKPILETVRVVDIGKLSGTEQNLWYNLNSAELSLSTAVGILAIGCQCIDGDGKTSIHCTMAAAQMDESGRFSLGLDGVQIYLKEARELIEKL